MHASSKPARSPSNALLVMLAACLLGACASTPLPPWPQQRPAPPPTASPAPPVPDAPGAPPVLDAPAHTAPVTSDVPAAPAATQPPTMPYGPAVAARFPDPAQRYDTPGLRAGRSAFTTQDELHEQLRSLAGNQPSARSSTVRLIALGNSQRGVPLEALVFARGAGGDPVAAAASGRPTVLLIGQQHGDEPAGGEALLALARELAGGRLSPLLDRINVLILPRANPDGALLGQRTGANGIDINRDHLLLRTPEAQAVAQLMREWRPAVVVDAHEYTVAGRFLEKFGALQRFDALLQYATTANMPPLLTRAAEEWFRRPMQEALRKEQLTVEWYYTTSADPNDKLVSMGGVMPDTGRNVNGLKNTISFLVETRGVGIGHLHAQRRVHTQVTAISSLLAGAAARAADLAKLRQFVEAEISAQACRGQTVLQAAQTLGEYKLLMLDPQTGADRAVTVDWNSSLDLQPGKLRARPCGYWLAADAGDAVQRLRALGVQVQTVAINAPVRADTYNELSRTNSARQDVRGSVADAAAVIAVQVELVSSLLDMPAGSYYVPLTQPLANLVIAALEPDTQSSYFAHGVLSGLDRVARVMVVPDAKVLAGH